MDFRQIQVETAKRMKELRKAVAHNLSPEEVAIRAKEKGFNIGPRTIRKIEHATANPSLETLHAILSFYDTTLHEFFRFTSHPSSDDARLVDALIRACKHPGNRKSLKAILDVMLNTSE